MQQEIIFNHTAHKALWNWLSKNPDKCKCDWKGWVRNGGKTRRAPADCFACETKYMCGKAEAQCSLHCPLCYNLTQKEDCLHNMYFKWSGSKRKDHRKLWAERIRDLPVRPDFSGKVI